MFLNLTQIAMPVGALTSIGHRISGVILAASVPAAIYLAHHLLGGVRHLLSDFDIGSPLRSARKSAWFVNLVGVAVALLAVVVVW